MKNHIRVGKSLRLLSRNRTLPCRSRRGGLDFKPTPDCKGPRSGLPTAMEPKGGTLESGVKDKADRTVCGHS